MATAVASPAAARVRHPVPRCGDRPHSFSWDFLIGPGNVPHANGCSTAVYNYGSYLGQDPDPNIRYQLSRDPAEGNGAFAR